MTIVTARSRQEVDRDRKRAPRPYFTLLERDDAKSPWAIQFGDYDQKNVQFELEDRRDHGAKAKNLRIVRTASDDQRSIDAVVAALNGGQA
jgi:hypothetical protein